MSAIRTSSIVKQDATAMRLSPSSPDTEGRLWERMTSEQALWQAWQRVLANGGGPGVDGMTLAAFAGRATAHLRTLRRELLNGEYRPAQVLRVYVPKRSGGQRPLSLLTVRDRVAQRAAHDALNPVFEPRFLPCSFAFREGRSGVDAARAIGQWRGRGYRWVVDGDIAQCFEHIEHALLLELLGQQIADRRVLRLIRTWLQAQVMNELAPASVMSEGVHQGGAISPLLSNVYLHEFDARLTEQKLALVRYADDWLILCRTEREAQAALQCATDALARLRLMVNPNKTRITHFDQGFAFIGMFFLGERTHWLSPAMAGMQWVGDGGKGERGMGAGKRLLRRLLGG